MTYTRLIGGHLDDPPPCAEPTLKAVALASLTWGRLEQHLDMLLISINKEDHTTGKYLPTPNTSFQMKIDRFKDWFVKDQRFSRYHDVGRALATRFKNAAADRTILTHCNLQEFIEGPPAKMVIRNILIKSDEVHMNRAEWTEEAINSFAKNLRGMNTVLKGVSDEVLTPDFLESLRVS